MRPLLAALALCLFAGPALAEDVELELVLLADSSGSIDMAEILFQRQGYAQAITDPRVLETIAATAYGRIAVTYVEWAAAGAESVVVPWTVVDGPDTATAFAEALMVPPRRAFGRNAIGSALLTGKRLIEENDIEGWRKVIDFSGDSANNWNGPSIEDARAEVLAAGIVINGLALYCRTCNGPSDDDLMRRYESLIIGGPGAFVVAAEDRDSFGEAVIRKLILEISGTLPESDVADAR
ncbi:DUF1194 domain-containing protein [Palleronia sp. KMU-117]|uniref:DUF1194 domain-containing protein n=1 Tax=Palleronia sp. KMU-117 TaxID=3434108 RepID=UPI003D733B51